MEMITTTTVSLSSKAVEEESNKETKKTIRIER